MIQSIHENYIPIKHSSYTPRQSGFCYSKYSEENSRVKTKMCDVKLIAYFLKILYLQIS